MFGAIYRSRWKMESGQSRPITNTRLVNRYGKCSCVVIGSWKGRSLSKYSTESRGSYSIRITGGHTENGVACCYLRTLILKVVSNLSICVVSKYKRIRKCNLYVKGLAERNKDFFGSYIFCYRGLADLGSFNVFRNGYYICSVDRIIGRVLRSTGVGYFTCLIIDGCSTGRGVLIKCFVKELRLLPSLIRFS